MVELIVIDIVFNLFSGRAVEFHYRIFDGPELLPSVALAYIEDRADLWKLQKAGLDGRYQLSLHLSMW